MSTLKEKTSSSYKTNIISIVWRPLFVSMLIMAILWSPLIACKHKSQAEPNIEQKAQTAPKLPASEPPQAKVPVQKEIVICQFFQFLEEIVRQNDTLSSYKLSENLLLRANPWILDTLVSTDYYHQMSLGNFVYDQKKMRVLKQGDTLLIPGPKTAAALLEKMERTRLDLNIPAFEMRILEGDSVLHTVPVRIGKKQKKYLEAAGHRVDLRTRTGIGEIVRVNRYPIFIDPVTGERFKFTKRDDQKTTLMPQIPWLEPVINGQRYGQMIHPTTNPRSLGKAASNGCIGVSEADAWRIYFYATLGTKVTIRYELQEINAQGDTLRYDDIYQLWRAGKKPMPLAVAGIWREKTDGICVCDSLF
ncbi:MAG: L,D-transpeptidase [Saprospiraceae bacterium]